MNHLHLMVAVLALSCHDGSGTTPYKDDTTGGDTSLPEPDRSLPWKDFSAAMTFTCGVRTNGLSECWGNEGVFWKEHESYYRDDRPPDERFEIIRVGHATWSKSQHACGITMGGETVCWGRNDFGQSTPPKEAMSTVEVGMHFSIGLTPTGGLLLWGKYENEFPEGHYLAVQTNYHSDVVALTDSGILVGRNMLGAEDPVLPTFSGRVVDFALGPMHGCAILDSGEVTCWYAGNWMDGIPNEQFKDICVMAYDACALRLDGTAACWGLEPWGKKYEIPETGFNRITCGLGHICGLTPDGEMLCWGYEAFGALKVPD